MSVHLRKEIEKLKKHILSVGTIVEESVRDAVMSIRRKDRDLAQRVIDDDLKIDQMEVEVEEECLKMLALYQPVAIDLRFIVAVLKINNDLERIGDLAVNIAERAICLAEQNVHITEKLYSMVDKAKTMLKKSLDALVNLDAELARLVCAMDDEVDELDREICLDLEKDMQNKAERIKWQIDIFSVSRNLERIADHATNIAEDVIYMIEGHIVRHMGETDQ